VEGTGEAPARPVAEDGAGSAWGTVVDVLRAPRAAFTALRDDSDGAAASRQEPILAIVWLAGIAGVLETTIAGVLLDDIRYDGVVLAVWAFVGGGLYGVGGYFLLGFLVFLGSALAGGRGSYRRARHMVAFAALPVALSLLLWPLRLLAYGGDWFRGGGDDTGAGRLLFEALVAGTVVWALVLLALAVRVVHGWSWPRTAAALVLSVAPAAAVVLAL
jgi:hypothetical protein